MIVVPLSKVPKAQQASLIKHAFSIHEGAARQMWAALQVILKCTCCKIDDKARAQAQAARRYYEEQSRKGEGR